MFNENDRNSYKSMHSVNGRDNQKLGISRYVTRGRWIKSEILHSYSTRELRSSYNYPCAIGLCTIAELN